MSMKLLLALLLLQSSSFEMTRAFSPLTLVRKSFAQIFQPSLSIATLHDGVNLLDQVSVSTTLDPLVVCGPSGVGKGTIIGRFLSETNAFGFSVSHTTRDPRPGEINGIHYHFTSKPLMESLLGQDYFLESAEVHGNIYGTSWQALYDVQKAGKKCLLDIDVQGVQRLKTIPSRESWRPRYIFIAPPSPEILESRLRGRATENEESLQRRISNARDEIEYGLEAGNFDAIVYNDDLENAIKDFRIAVHKLYEM
ncbi:guanylate kinase [Fistulifera solaris]|uniref:guanylate kinase n=1 Tax=Fistulifera solaris TaxID=1519565 RepID=A0A1Z5KG64_FISSO|nr:guanylate kinase [Fistulifera solaris]|eukprot:GAX25283.1 guanylate kinase [Fistulifera solaris]